MLFHGPRLMPETGVTVPRAVNEANNIRNNRKKV